MYNTVKIKIKGKNVTRFIQKINKNNIEIYNINKINRNEIIIIINYNDLDKIKEVKTIYEIEIINYYGINKIKKQIKKHEILLFCLMIGLVLLIFLTHIIFKVEVIHNDPKLRNMMIKELSNYDIKPYKMVKTYEEIEQIKKHILNKYQNKIEWMEIERNGTKYIVRLEERIKTKEKKETENRNIVAKNNAVIMEIDAEAGDIVKKVGDYVKKGDIIISGSINLNEETKSLVSAKGKIYGEVWYQVTTKIPIHYYSKQKTNKKQNWYYLKIGNKNINLFHKSYKNSINKKQILLKNNIIPIMLIKEHQQEVKIKEKIYLDEEVTEEAYNQVKKEITKKLNQNEQILSIKKLKQTKKDSKIIVEFFISVKKDITSFAAIKEDLDVRDNKQLP